MSKLDKMNANDEQSENRGTTRAGASVDDALVAAKHVNEEIDWKSVGTFECYHCAHAFSKNEDCVFVFCSNCHVEYTKKVIEKRGGQEENDRSGAASRRGNRERKEDGIRETNVCENLKKGACGRHTWGDLADLKLETSKGYTWRERSKKEKDAGFAAKYCFGCGLIV